MEPFLPGFLDHISVGEDFGYVGDYKIVGISMDSYAIEIDGCIEIISLKVHKPSFRVLGEGFYCDKKKIYQGKEEIECLRRFVNEIDLPSVRLIAQNSIHFYIADNERVLCSSYLGSGWIEGADSQSFDVIDAKKFFAYDKNHYYYHHDVMTAPPDECVFLNDFYLLYDDKIYWGYTEVIQEADAKSFQIVENNRRLRNVGRDKKHVYFHGMPVPLVDSATFEILPGCVHPSRSDIMDWNAGKHDFVRDAKNLWFVNTDASTNEAGFRLLKVSHPSEFDFRVVNEKGYATDGVTWFYETRKVKPPIADEADAP